MTTPNQGQVFDAESQPISRPTASLQTETIVQRSLWMDAVRRFRRNKLAMFGLVIIVLLIFMAIFADVIAPYDYDRVFFTIRHPVKAFTNPDHPLGTDSAGRDYLSRLIFGARTSMFIGLLSPLIAFSIGIPLGAVAGYKGGKWDFVISRLIEIGTGLPGLIFALLLLTVLGTGVLNVILVLSITSWIGPARIARGQFIATRDREYVTAAKALGATEREILTRHIFANAFSPLLIAFSFSVPGFIFAEAGLSFLGLGITEPTASWGKMVGGGVGTTVTVFWHLALLPTLMIALTMLGFLIRGRWDAGGAWMSHALKHKGEKCVILIFAPYWHSSYLLCSLLPVARGNLLPPRPPLSPQPHSRPLRSCNIPLCQKLPPQLPKPLQPLLPGVGSSSTKKKQGLAWAGGKPWNAARAMAKPAKVPTMVGPY